MGSAWCSVFCCSCSRPDRRAGTGEKTSDYFAEEKFRGRPVPKDAARPWGLPGGETLTASLIAGNHAEPCPEPAEGNQSRVLKHRAVVKDARAGRFCFGKKFCMTRCCPPLVERAGCHASRPMPVCTILSTAFAALTALSIAPATFCES